MNISSLNFIKTLYYVIGITSFFIFFLIFYFSFSHIEIGITFLTDIFITTGYALLKFLILIIFLQNLIEFKNNKENDAEYTGKLELFNSFSYFILFLII